MLKQIENAHQTESCQKVLHWFFCFPNDEKGLTELAKELKISKTTANKTVSKLVKKELLKKQVISNLWRIKANNNTYFIKQKISYNLNLIYNTNLIEEIYKKIPNAQAIILFGSYRKGSDTEKSDIDIAVEIIDNKNLEIKELGKIPRLDFRKNIPINLYIFSRNKINLNLFANIANGIILDGFLEVKL